MVYNKTMAMWHPPMALDKSLRFCCIEPKTCKEHDFMEFEGGGKEWDTERKYHKYYICKVCKWIKEGEWVYPEPYSLNEVLS